MLYKQIPQDFLVDEIYDLEDLKNKEKEEGKKYHYLILKKTNYAQLRAIDKVKNIFNIKQNQIHFAGTKDKVGITTQLISITGVSKDKIDKSIEYANSEVPDINLEYVGEFPKRLNLGDNQGNKFTITLRDLEKEDIQTINQNKVKIEKEGVKNYFDEQRFGYANNSHIVGKYILKNEVELAIKEILTSTPKEPHEELTAFIQYIKDNWQEIKEQNVEIIEKAQEIAPKHLRTEVDILDHLKKAKNDFPGSFRRIQKKQRTLYINAYQSYLFNQLLDSLNPIPEKLFLLNKNTPTAQISYGKELDKLIKKDDITKDHFKLPSMPELRLNDATRLTKIFPQNIQIGKEASDELNENKLKLIMEFELESGSYATNVIKQMCKKDL